MPIYTEKAKDKNGKIIDKKVNGQKQYYIRTYIDDERGNRKQITRHNKKWLGKDGYIKAMQEEVRLKNEKAIKKNKEQTLTMSELKNKYLDFENPRVDVDTLKSKATKLEHLCTEFSNKQIKSFSKEDYANWQKEMRTKTFKRGEKIYNFSIKYLNKVHNEIKLMFDFALNEGLIIVNPAAQVGKFGTPKEISLSNQNNIYNVINYKEYLRLMQATAGNKRYNTLFDLFFSRGLRAGEVRALRVQDFDYKKKQLTVNHTLSKSNLLKPPKTASSKAPIDLDDSLAEKINDLINDMKNKANFNEQWYIFNGETPLSAHAMDYNKDKYFKVAKINKHLRLHDFRHSCATWLFSIGTPITVISRILRHKDISITMSTYTHLIEEDYKKELKRINDIKSGKQNQKQDQKQDQKI